jgi:3-deoxy-D-manno-octulosonate 8-phosphate phosphatase (KDO 8-P phosphatase)
VSQKPITPSVTSKDSFQKIERGQPRHGMVSPEILRNIKLLATDVDGVLTDAGMYYAESGDEWKKFNTRDGMGLKLLQAEGIITAIITMENTQIVARRGQKLKIPEVFQGITKKAEVLALLSEKYRISYEEMAYIGDDVNDLPALRLVGFSAAPADGIEEVRNTVHYVCQKKGGEGAVREICDKILRAKAGGT